jgi:uncharacterized membrane protein
MNTESISVMNPKSMSIDRGAGWLLEGFGYFKNSALNWIGACILLFAITIVLGLVPFIGGLAVNILMPVFMAGLILGCHAQHQGGEFTVNHLFAGFSNNTAQLIVLGLIYLLGMIAITIVALIMIFFMLGGLAFLEHLDSGNPEMILQNIKGIMLILLVVLLIYLPLVMAYWFAPALIVLNDVSPVDALIMSFKGCLANILPFTLYGIVGLVLAVIAVIPLGLGMLILGPMIIASVYIAYRDIFAGQ